MNCKDIESARKIIEQFEGKALGRHNSNEWERPGGSLQRSRTRLSQAVIVDDWSKCDVGQYCFAVAAFDSEYYSGSRLIRTINPINVFNLFKEEIGVEDRTYMEFEIVRIYNLIGGTKKAWRRIT